MDVSIKRVTPLRLATLMITASVGPLAMNVFVPSLFVMLGLAMAATLISLFVMRRTLEVRGH